MEPKERHLHLVNNEAQEEEQVTYVQDELLTEREVLEGYTPEELVAYKSFLLTKLSYLEKEVHLINDVLDGYGYTRNMGKGITPDEY